MPRYKGEDFKLGHYPTTLPTSSAVWHRTRVSATQQREFDTLFKVTLSRQDARRRAAGLSLMLPPFRGA
jgi:hypothetical protein